MQVNETKDKGDYFCSKMQQQGLLRLRFGWDPLGTKRVQGRGRTGVTTVTTPGTPVSLVSVMFMLDCNLYFSLSFATGSVLNPELWQRDHGSN